MLSKYASEIIKILVHQDDKFITNAQIAKMLNVSERSVSSYIDDSSVSSDPKTRKRNLFEVRVHKEELEQEFPEKKSMY